MINIISSVGVSNMDRSARMVNISINIIMMSSMSTGKFTGTDTSTNTFFHQIVIIVMSNMGVSGMSMGVGMRTSVVSVSTRMFVNKVIVMVSDMGVRTSMRMSMMSSTVGLDVSTDIIIAIS